MIQDASVVRDGVPDSYKAYFKLDVVVAATTWTLNTDRLPSGFLVNNGSANGTQGRSGTGVANIVFPAGLKVRHAQASITLPTAVAGSYRTASVANISETNGTAQVLITDGGLTTASPLAADPVVNSIIWVELTLETV